MKERTRRLSLRFEAIQVGLSIVYGKDAAFAAASAAWLQAIQFAFKEGMEKIALDCEASARGDIQREITRIDLEMEQQMQAFHKEICEHLNVNREQAIDLYLHFHEVVKDICNQKG